jgi:hypothetical protein
MEIERENIHNFIALFTGFSYIMDIIAFYIQWHEDTHMPA